MQAFGSLATYCALATMFYLLVWCSCRESDMQEVVVSYLQGQVEGAFGLQRCSRDWHFYVLSHWD